MPHVFQTQCFFKGPELAKLCVENTDIMITVTVSYPPGKEPSYEIVATGWNQKNKILEEPPVVGCPSPCH
jgi:hypothetical protein